MTTIKPVRRAGLALVAALALAAPSFAATPTRETLDPDHDGTMDLAEARDAAAKTFDRLDRNHAGALGARELGGRLKGEVVGSDPGKLLNKDEYLGLVEQRFHAADIDKDGALDAGELAGPAGKALIRLLK